jgi:hypothetical protein
MQPAQTRGIGPLAVQIPPSTTLLPVDSALQFLVAQLGAWRQRAGVVLQPGDDLSALTACKAGDSVVLLPGQYDVRQTITLPSRIRLFGWGATLAGSTLLVNVTGDDVQLVGLQFVRTDRVAAAATAACVSISGDGAQVANCLFQSASPYGLYVAGNYCGAYLCKSLPDSNRVAGDADLYWADGATNGTCCGTLFSRSPAGAWALDYRAIDGMTQDANGLSPTIVNIR